MDLQIFKRLIVLCGALVCFAATAQPSTIESRVTGSFEGSTTNKTTGDATNNQVLAFGSGSGGDNVANRYTVSYSATASASTRWGSGVVNAAADVTLGGDLSSLTDRGHSTRVIATSKQNEDLTFVWLPGFDATQPIPVVMHRHVSFVRNSGGGVGDTNASGRFRLNVKDFAAPGSETQALSLYSSLAANNLPTVDRIEVSVLNNGLVQVFADLEVTGVPFAKFGHPNAREGAIVNYAFSIEVPVGVAVSSDSGHDYSQLAAVPEPACLTLLVLGGLVAGVRRRH